VRALVLVEVDSLVLAEGQPWNRSLRKIGVVGDDGGCRGLIKFGIQYYF